MFFVWAWQDSGKAMASATIRSTGGGYFMIGQTQGAAVMLHSSSFNLFEVVDFFSLRQPNAKITRKSPVHSMGNWHFPVAFESQRVGDDTSPARFTFLAWWAIAAVYIISWLAAVMWRQRRKYRKLRMEMPQGSIHIEG